MWAICQNPDCGNYRWPINIGDITITDPETGETITSEVYCGVCGTRITEIVDTKPADPETDDPDVE